MTSSPEKVNTEEKAEGEPKLSKKQLKKLAKGKNVKKEKPKWNLEGKKDKKKEKNLKLNEDEIFVNKTKAGEKKDLAGNLADKYNPDAVESSWDLWWEKKGYYGCKAEEMQSTKPEDRFVMVLPPPNVTGTLHIGHALMITVEDTLARYNRMLGKKVLWVPGTDHAGIATQSTVEANILKKEGKFRTDFSREDFLKRVWNWTDEKGGKIIAQMRRMGASLDHSRSVFTLDEVRSKAVMHAFCKMHEMGLIYRKKRLVNWSSQLTTAISNIEVDTKELEKRTMIPLKSHGGRKYEFGVLTEFKYPVFDKDTNNLTGDSLTVATTRLETMLGDTAVAIHPDDTRYKHLHGKFVKHPFFDRLIPIVLDGELVDMNFGTGCVKITPAHDENDYNCGARHGLPMLNMLSDDGKIDITECKENVDEECLGDQFHGMMRYDARKALEKALEEMGLLGEKKDNKMILPICSRSGDVVEPRLKEQWWVDVTDASRRAVEAVEKDELKLLPAFHKDTWYRFLNDPHQWCISRQLWWGHRIPAFEVTSTNESFTQYIADNDLTWIVAETGDIAQAKLKQIISDSNTGVSEDDVVLEQDEDVLDTWFSSGLFPFSVLGWPDKTADMDKFFPGTILETGHDILFFWVARMVMMSLILHDKLPFETVYLHAIVRDRYGRKMSKSLGNIIDPLAVINGCTLEALNESIRNSNLPDKEIAKAIKGQNTDYPDGIPQCGSDALRFGLLSNINQGRDVNLDINSVFSTRKFCNKLWQVTRFSILICGDNLIPEKNFLQNLSKYQLSYKDKWILNELKVCVENCNKHIKSYYFGEYTNSLTIFWLSKLCDVYVESIKPLMKLSSEEGASAELKEQAKISRNVLFYSLDIGLKLMHPVMPYVTEELWQNLPGNKQRLLNYTTDEESNSGLQESIMISKFPTASDIIFDDFSEAIEVFETGDKIAHGMRSLKADYNVKSKDVKFYVFVDQQRLSGLKDIAEDINCLGSGIIELEAESKLEDFGKGFVANVLDGHLQVMMELKGNVDIDARVKKLSKERDQSKKQQEQLEKKLSNEKFLSSAPEQVLNDSRTKLEDFRAIIDKLSKQIEDLKLL